MGKETKIEWCHHTVNPTPCCSGCPLFSEDKSRNVCYAYSLWSRYTSSGTTGKKGWVRDFRTWEDSYTVRLKHACSWSPSVDNTKKPWLKGMKTIIFVNDMGDSFSPIAPLDWMYKYIPAMEERDDFVWLHLTKWPDRMALSFDEYGYVPENFWLGNSVIGGINQSSVDEIKRIKDTFPGVHTFLSMEPVMPGRFGGFNPHDVIGEWYDWVILGGASGNNAEPLPLWCVEKTVDACRSKGVPLFFKQWGSFKPVMSEGRYTGKYEKVGKYNAGREYFGMKFSQMPDDMRRET